MANAAPGPLVSREFLTLWECPRMLEDCRPLVFRGYHPPMQNGNVRLTFLCFLSWGTTRTFVTRKLVDKLRALPSPLVWVDKTPVNIASAHDPGGLFRFDPPRTAQEGERFFCQTSSAFTSPEAGDAPPIRSNKQYVGNFDLAFCWNAVHPSGDLCSRHFFRVADALVIDGPLLSRGNDPQHHVDVVLGSDFITRHPHLLYEMQTPNIVLCESLFCCRKPTLQTPQNELQIRVSAVADIREHDGLYYTVGACAVYFGSDSAYNTIYHFPSLGEVYSSRPERPSQRRVKLTSMIMALDMALKLRELGHNFDKVRVHGQVPASAPEGLDSNQKIIRKPTDGDVERDLVELIKRTRDCLKKKSVAGVILDWLPVSEESVRMFSMCHVGLYMKAHTESMGIIQRYTFGTVDPHDFATLSHSTYTGFATGEIDEVENDHCISFANGGLFVVFKPVLKYFWYQDVDSQDTAPIVH